MAKSRGHKILGIAATDTTEAQESVLSEGVIHALNCTFEDFRDAHYDECVKDPSRIYLRPQAGPDDTGHIAYDTPVLYALLDDYSSVE